MERSNNFFLLPLFVRISPITSKQLNHLPLSLEHSANGYVAATLSVSYTYMDRVLLDK